MRKYPPLRKRCSLLDKRERKNRSVCRKGQSSVVVCEGRLWCKKGMARRLWGRKGVVCNVGYNCGVGCKCGVVVKGSNEVLCIHFHSHH